MGPRAFPVNEVHKITVLDIRLANADRHAGNILLSKEGEEGQLVLIPIDHGYCLPENVSNYSLLNIQFMFYILSLFFVDSFIGASTWQACIWWTVNIYYL